MLEFQLQPHAINDSTSVNVKVLRDNNLIRIAFDVESASPLANAEPNSTLQTFTDNLWHSTCFELFIAQTRHTNYIEWNLTTDGRYAVYYFKDIRQRADTETQERAKTNLIPQEFKASSLPDKLLLEWALPIKTVHDFVGHPDWYIQPTAILETVKGNKSYWAPSHSKPEPDFHTFSHLPSTDLYS